MHAYVLSHSAQSLSLVQLLQSHGLYPARLHCSWDQKYWSGLPFPPPGYLPNLGIKPVSPMSSVLHGNSLALSHQWSHLAHSHVISQQFRGAHWYFKIPETCTIILSPSHISAPLGKSITAQEYRIKENIKRLYCKKLEAYSLVRILNCVIFYLP